MNTNLRKKALLPAIAMVLVSVIALSGVTYAWFTTSNTATVSELTVNVEAADGIQISLDAKTWRSKLVGSEIVSGGYDGNTNQVPTGPIFPVSTVGELNSDGQMKMFNGKLMDDVLTVTAATDTKGTEGNYIAFDLFFNMSAEKEIKLDMSDTSVIDDTQYAAQKSSYSSRVAFIDLGAATTATDAQKLNTLDNDASVLIWEPNADQHLESVLSSGVPATKQPYEGVQGVDPETGAAVLANVTTSEITESTAILNLEEGINKVRIYIWMEGQDVDCINDASGGKFITKLQFAQPAAETTVA